MKSFLVTLAGVAFTLNAFAKLPVYEIPKDWHIAGSKAKSYDMGIDKGAGPNGKNAATIKSNTDSIAGFGTLTQTCLPDKYKGKRVRMSAKMKCANVENAAAMWFRVDGKDRNRGSLAFDNMSNRPLRGNSDWTNCDIVLDIPMNAVNLAYGALLNGTGQLWFADVKFEVVDNSVPSTDMRTGQSLRKEPANLDFEK